MQNLMILWVKLGVQNAICRDLTYAVIVKKIHKRLDIESYS
jgi:hypothetical protein